MIKDIETTGPLSSSRHIYVGNKGTNTCACLNHNKWLRYLRLWSEDKYYSDKGQLQLAVTRGQRLCGSAGGSSLCDLH